MDKLTYISIENQTTEFPKHFHETFCISLIRKGVEKIDFENSSLFSEAGSISITNPFEIHSNPLIDPMAQLKFDTIYIPNMRMQQVLSGKNITFVERKIKSKTANNHFEALLVALRKKEDKEIDYQFQQFIESILAYSKEHKNEYNEFDLSDFQQINKYIEERICENFSLSTLAELAHINKYGFAKKFKASTGMTPMNYILMRKIFSSKQLIDDGIQLTDIAFQYNFTDLAHYSKTFKRYIGLSPKVYQARIAKPK